MSRTARLRGFSSKAACKTERGEGVKLNFIMTHTCIHVHVCPSTQNMYMYADGYTRHFIIVIYWQAGWLVDLFQPSNFHRFLPGLGIFQESRQLSRDHTPGMDEQGKAGLGEAR